jgi:acetyl-CoA synthetase
MTIMINLHQERIPATTGRSNIGNYETAREQFDWGQIEQQFTWHTTAKVNMAYEAIDRHVQEGRGSKIALHYSDASRDESWTFEQLSQHSNRFANVLRKQGVHKGDRVFIFMPRTPELYISLLGILKVGAVAGPLFEAFMETAVKDRLLDSGAKAIITTPQLLGRIKRDELPDLERIIVFGEVEAADGIISYEQEMSVASDEAEIEWLGREDGLILHYTSGSTGKPKGVFHVQNAMLQHYYTGKIVLDLREDDVYWCTADPGWVTGTSYGVFAPWLNGATNVIRGGRFSPQDWYGTIQRYGVTVWYSAPAHGCR